MVAEFKRSGLGRQAFCRLYGIGETTFDRWMKENPGESSFVPVCIDSEVVVAPGATRGGARLVGPRGFVLEFSPQADAAWIADVCGRLL